MVYKPVGWEVYDNHSPQQLVDFVRGHVAHLSMFSVGISWTWGVGCNCSPLVAMLAQHGTTSKCQSLTENLY